MGIGENIRRYRKAAGLSQEQLAELIGKTRSAVSQYENNTTTPYMYVIERIAAALGVETVDIVGETERLTEREGELLELYRAMSVQGQMQLMIYARGLAATYPKDKKVQTA